MMLGPTNGKSRYYLGVDVGGTKIQASVVEEAGLIAARHKSETPRSGGTEKVLGAIEQTVKSVLEKAGVKAGSVLAMGVGLPGTVDPRKGRVVLCPNLGLSNFNFRVWIEKRLDIPTVIGNDCDLGTLGERWLGAGRKSGSVAGLFVGTGIGGGFVRKGKLWRGFRDASMEVGHIRMQPNGPKCSCGNRGCLEALASRSAIEREIRRAVAAGERTVLTELGGGNLSVIRSSALKRALQVEDKLVVRVMRQTAEVLGSACLTIRHVLDPELIIMGGGVIQACGDFILPIIDGVVQGGEFPGARADGKVLLSALGDDAVVLGAVALARKHVERCPFKQSAAELRYPRITMDRDGTITVGRKSYDLDIYARVNGTVKKRREDLAKERYGNARLIGPDELERVCRGGPEVLFIGTGLRSRIRLTEEGKLFLRLRDIDCRVSPTRDVIQSYNRSAQRKAAILHVEKRHHRDN